MRAATHELRFIAVTGLLLYSIPRLSGDSRRGLSRNLCTQRRRLRLPGRRRRSNQPNTQLTGPSSHSLRYLRQGPSSSPLPSRAPRRPAQFKCTAVTPQATTIAAATSDPHTPPPSRPTVSETRATVPETHAIHARPSHHMRLLSRPPPPTPTPLPRHRRSLPARRSQRPAQFTSGLHTTCDYYRGRHLRPPPPSPLPRRIMRLCL